MNKSQKSQKKRIQKINIQYESNSYTALMCVITCMTNHKLITSIPISHRKKCSVHLANHQYLWNLDIRFYTTNTYELLATYHFNNQETGTRDDVIQHTQYYCRIKKEDVKGCLIMFDFFYQFDEDYWEIKKLDEKISNYHNNNNCEQKKYEEVSYLLHCHQIVKKVYAKLSNDAVKEYFQQKQRQRQIVKQLRQIYSDVNPTCENGNFTRYDLMTKNKHVSSNNYIKPTVLSNRRIQQSQRLINLRKTNQTQFHIQNHISANRIKQKYYQSINSNNSINQSTIQKSENQEKSFNENKYQKVIKKVKRGVKRITIQNTLQPQIFHQCNQSNTSKPSTFLKKQAIKQIRWGDLQGKYKLRDKIIKDSESQTQKVETEKNKDVQQNKTLSKKNRYKDIKKLKMICQLHNKQASQLTKVASDTNKQNKFNSRQHFSIQQSQYNTEKQLKNLLQNRIKSKKIQHLLIKDYLTNKNKYIIQNNKFKIEKEFDKKSHNNNQTKICFQSFEDLSIQNLTRLYRKSIRVDEQKAQINNKISNISLQNRFECKLESARKDKKEIKNCIQNSRPQIKKIKSTPSSFRNQRPMCKLKKDYKQQTETKFQQSNKTATILKRR